MTNPVILVVDDQPEDADLLGMLFELAFPQARVCVAYGAHHALERAAQEVPDVAVLDIEMPRMDGVELAKVFKAAFPTNPPLLIALSGNLLRLSELRGTATFDHLLSKPTDVDAMIRIMSPRVCA